MQNRDGTGDRAGEDLSGKGESQTHSVKEGVFPEQVWVKTAEQPQEN